MTVRVAREDHRATSHRSHDGAARRIELVVEADTDPRGGEDLLLLVGVEGLVDVTVGRERVGLVDGTSGPDPGFLGGPSGLRDEMQLFGGSSHAAEVVAFVIIRTRRQRRDGTPGFTLCKV